MNHVTLRDYQPQDLPWLAQLFILSVTEVASRDYSAAQIRAWAQVDEACWRERLARARVFVACDGEKRLGFISLEHEGHIDLLFVHPQALRRGVAAALLARLEQAARQQRLTRLTTDASITARPFFAANGFSIEQVQTVALRGETFTNYRMVKTLSTT